jgi:vitamin B12 transporter
VFLDVSPRRLSSALFLIVGPVVLRAQERRDTVRLEPIVVTATRLATPATAIASAVTVLRGDDLRAQGITTVADALRAVPGAAIVRTGSLGGQTSLFLRGGESDYVKVLVDGVPVNQPGGAFDWADLTTDNVERIEVVRGPGSVLYGSDAVAGVVQVFTRRGAGGGPAVAQASVAAGTYGTVRAEAEVTGGSEEMGYAFAASRLATDGNYAFNNAYRNTVLSGLVRLRPDDRSDATLSLRATSSTFHYPTNGAGRLVDHNQFRYGDVTTLGLDLGRYLTRRVEARLQIATNAPVGGLDNQRDSAADSSVYRSLDDQRRTLVGARANVYLAGGTVLTAGIEVERQRLKSFNVCNSAFGPCSTDPSDHHRGNRGYFVQALADLGPALVLTAGARLDDNDAFGTHATYRVGAAWRLPGATRLRAALGTGFKEPTFFENFANDPFAKGNPSLKPERSVSWELGAERSLAGGRVALTATYFSQRFRDLVDFTFAPPSPTDPNYFNVEGALADGLEATATATPWPGVSVTAGYTYLHTRVTRSGFDSTPDAAFAPGAALLRRPTHSADLRVRWSVAGGRLGTWLAGARYVGTRVDQDFSTFPFPRVRLSAYALMDVAFETGEIRTGGSRGGPGLRGTLRIENLFDRRYEEIRGFPGRQRTILAGVRAGFGR